MSTWPPEAPPEDDDVSADEAPAGLSELEARVAGGESLAGLDLSGLNLEEARLAGAHLVGADLSSSALRGADLRGADLTRARLNGALFDAAHLEGATLRGVEAEGCSGVGAHLRGADLREARFSSATLNGADLRGARLEGARFPGCDLRGTRLRPEQVTQTDLAGALVAFEGAAAETVPPSRARTLMLEGLPHRVHHWAPTLEAGADDAVPPLVALHGFTGGGEDFAALAPHLGRGLWAPDLLGHGHSDAPRDPAVYAVEAQVRRLRALFEALDLPPVPLLGYSMGGRIALRFALEHPERVAALVLVGAHPGLADHAARTARLALDEARAAQLEQLGVKAFLAEWQAQPLIATQARILPAVREDLQDRRARGRSWGWAATLRGMSPGRTADLHPRLPALACPTLLLTGADDADYTAAARSLLGVLPRAVHVCVEGAGHAAHLEQIERAAGAIRRFIDAPP